MNDEELEQEELEADRRRDFMKQVKGFADKALNFVPCSDPGDGYWHYSELADVYYHALAEISSYAEENS